MATSTTPFYLRSDIFDLNLSRSNFSYNVRYLHTETQTLSPPESSYISNITFSFDISSVYYHHQFWTYPSSGRILFYISVYYNNDTVIYLVNSDHVQWTPGGVKNIDLNVVYVPFIPSGKKITFNLSMVIYNLAGWQTKESSDNNWHEMSMYTLSSNATAGWSDLSCYTAMEVTYAALPVSPTTDSTYITSSSLLALFREQDNSVSDLTQF